MAEHTFFYTTILIAVVVMFIFGMKYWSAARQARHRQLDQESWRDAAAKATAAQTVTAATLAAVRADVSEIKASLVSLEKILREVG